MLFRYSLPAVSVHSEFQVIYFSCFKKFQCSNELICLNFFWWFLMFYKSASIIIGSCLSCTLEIIETIRTICEPVMFAGKFLCGVS